MYLFMDGAHSKAMGPVNRTRDSPLSITIILYIRNKKKQKQKEKQIKRENKTNHVKTT